jgi:hypothetical protein
MSQTVKAPPLVDFGCIRCERPIGAYVLEPQRDGSIVPIDPAGHPIPGAIPDIDWTGAIPVAHTRRLYAEPRYGSARRRKGPRTGTRLSVDHFEGRWYVRVKCKCGRDEKLGARRLDELLFDTEDVLRLRKGIVYL